MINLLSFFKQSHPKFFIYRRMIKPGSIPFMCVTRCSLPVKVPSCAALEGGDVVWLDERTLAVGRGYRTNDEGIRQLKELTSDIIDEYVVVPLPHWKGPEDVMHLMSLISPVDHGLAVVYSNLLPVPFLERLLKRGIKLLDVPDDEFETMGCNILAMAPGKCVMVSGNPQMKRMLEHEGVEVWEYAGEEISRKGAGGPTCLTQPLLREVD